MAVEAPEAPPITTAPAPSATPAPALAQISPSPPKPQPAGTTPMYDAQGNFGYMPQEHVQDAITQNYESAVQVLDAHGNKGWMPQSKMDLARQQGYKEIPPPSTIQKFQASMDQKVNDPSLMPDSQSTVAGKLEHYGTGFAQSLESVLVHPLKTGESAIELPMDVLRATGVSPEFTGMPLSDPGVQKIRQDARDRLAAQWDAAKKDPLRTAGQLTGGAVISHGLGELGEGAINAAKALPEKVSGVMENLTGTTTALEKAGEKQVKSVTTADKANAKSAAAYDEAKTEHAQKVADIQKQNAEDLAEHQQRVKEITQQNELGEKEAAAKSQQNHIDAVEHHAQITQDAEDLETSRGDLARREAELRSRLADRVRSVADKAKATVDAQWEGIRSAVKAKGADEVPSADLVQKVEEVKSGLKGAQETIPEFESIIKRANDSGLNETSARVLKDEQDRLIQDRNMPKADGAGPAATYADLSDAWKGVVDETVKKNREMRAAGIETLDPAGDPVLGWDHLRAMSSELGDYLRTQYRKGQMGGNVNGELVAGVQKVKAHVDAMVDAIAAKAKVKGKLDTAKADYQIYKDTFREPTGPSGSGSGVAQALNARPRDIYNATQPFVDAHTGPLARNMLTGSPHEGPHFDPRAGQLVDALRNTVAERKGLAKPKPVPEFEAPEPVQPPKAKAVPEEPEPKELPKAPKPPEMREVAPLDTAEIKRQHLKNLARKYGNWAPWQFRALASGIGGGIAGEILGHPALGSVYGVASAGAALTPFLLSKLIDTDAFMDFVSKSRPRDMEVLGKLKGADKIHVQDGITGQIVHVIESGKKVKVSPQLQGYLGAANIMRIGKAISNAKGTVAGVTGSEKIKMGLAGMGAVAGATGASRVETGTSEGAQR